MVGMCLITYSVCLTTSIYIMYGTIFQHVYETCFQSVFHVHTWHVHTAPDVTNVDNALRVVSVELQTMSASADISFPVS